MPSRRGRPDYPIEAARRGQGIALDALTEALEYLRQPEGADKGHDTQLLITEIEAVLTRLEHVEGALGGPYNASVPSEALEALEAADQAIVNVIVTSHIEDVHPRLHEPQERLRACMRTAQEEIERR